MKDMPGFPKKWIRHGMARIAVAVAYLFITFTIPLSHTCNLHKADPQACHSNGTFHCCSFESPVCTQSEFKLKKSSCRTESRLYHSFCEACVYSMNCRATEISSAAAPIIIEIPDFVQYSPDSRITKRLEWTSSIFLRAPPVSIS